MLKKEYLKPKFVATDTVNNEFMTASEQADFFGSGVLGSDGWEDETV